MAFTISGGCAPDELKPPPVTESENLNNLLTDAPIVWINLNHAEIDTIIIPAEQIFEERLFVNESLYVANPIQIKTFQDRLVIIEFASGNVAATGRDGIPVQTIGRSGRGPGEFERPIAVMSNGTHLFIYDDGLKRISVFDEGFILTDTFSFTDAHYFNNKFRMSERHLVHQNNNASGFHASEPDGNLLHVRQIEYPDSVIFEAMPRIVPTGMHPGAYNNLLISVNSKDEILAAYPGLPYLFLYRDFSHEITIALEAVYFDTTENPGLRPYPPLDNEGVRVTGVLNHIYLKDDGDILITSFRLLHHLKPQPDGSYTHHRSYCLIREDTGEQIMTIRDLDFFPDDPDRMYAIGWGFIFELELPD